MTTTITKTAQTVEDIYNEIKAIESRIEGIAGMYEAEMRRSFWGDEDVVDIYAAFKEEQANYANAFAKMFRLVNREKEHQLSDATLEDLSASAAESIVNYYRREAYERVGGQLPRNHGDAIDQWSVIQATGGYDAIITDFYYVTKRTPNTVTLRTLKKITFNHCGMDGWDVKPAAVTVGKPFVKCVQVADDGTEFIRLDNGKLGFLWDGQPIWNLC